MFILLVLMAGVVCAQEMLLPASTAASQVVAIRPYPEQFPLPSLPPGQNVPIYYADNNDCNQYYQCQKLRCPTNMLWSDRSQRCDLPYLSECAAKYPSQQYPFQQYPSQQYPSIQYPFMPTIASTPSVAPVNIVETVVQPQLFDLPALNELDALCAQYMGMVYINYPGDCHRFIQCHGVAFVNTCPGNLFWNSMLKTCDTQCV